MGRIVIPLRSGWYFEEYPEQMVPPFSVEGTPVTLPHTWNREADNSYHRGACLYTRELSLEHTLAGRKLYLEFQ